MTTLNPVSVAIRNIGSGVNTKLPVSKKKILNPAADASPYTLSSGVQKYQAAKNQSISSIQNKPTPPASDVVDFSAMVNRALQTMQQKIKNAEIKSIEGTLGKANIEDIIVAVAEADANVQGFKKVHETILNSFQELLRIPV